MSFEHIFDEMEITAEPFALCELHGRCALGLGGQLDATLHYILAGSGEIVFKDRLPVKIERGTLVLVPAIKSHTLRSSGKTGLSIPNCHPAELDLARHLVTAEDTSTEGALLAICSHVKVGLRGTNALVDLVRQPLVERITDNAAIEAPIDGLLRELSQPSMGSKAMIRVLLLECMIHLLRSRLRARDHALNWMAALVDEKLWAALQQMLKAPGHPHTAESLAQTAGLSRSAFSARFSIAYGSGPMELLREMRMHEAATLLLRSDLPVKRVAERVGFRSRSAFSRAFISATGQSPKHFRNSG